MSFHNVITSETAMVTQWHGWNL